MRHIREKQRLSSRGKLATYSWHPSSFGPFWSHPPPQPPRPRHRPLLFGSLQALTDRAKEWHGRGETANRGMVRRLESNFHLKNAPETLPWMMDSYIQNPRRNFFSDKKKWESNYFLREGYRNPWFLPIYLFQMMLGGGWERYLSLHSFWICLATTIKMGKVFHSYVRFVEGNWTLLWAGGSSWLVLWWFLVGRGHF